MNPRSKVKIKWSPKFAYAIGLITSDGCLSPDGRHVTFVSKDREQLLNFIKALDISVALSGSRSGYNGKNTARVQFSDVLFYRFLLSIGLMPNKSKVVGSVKIPAKYFFDFLRGLFDGDGSTYSYWDSRWKSSFMFYTAFASASKSHIYWLRDEIYKRLKIRGHVTEAVKHSTVQLKYAKADSMKLFRRMYPNKNVLCLSRKYLKIKKILNIDDQCSNLECRCSDNLMPRC